MFAITFVDSAIKVSFKSHAAEAFSHYVLRYE